MAETAETKTARMTANNKRIILAATSLLTLLTLLAGCAKPGGDYFFVSTETARAQGGHYDFTLSLDDTTGTYTVRLAARLVASNLPDQQVAFDIHLTSPVGETTIERKAFPLSESGTSRLTAGNGSVVDCEWLLNDKVRVAGPEAGSWRITIAPTNPIHFDAIYGIGISYESDHGKR